MIAGEFEDKLKAQGFYFESPGLFVPGTDKDAEYYSAEQLLDILTHENDFRKMVRKRSEQTGSTTYYMKDEAATEYFKITVPNSTSAAARIDLFALAFRIKQIKDTLAVRLGLW